MVYTNNFLKAKTYFAIASTCILCAVAQGAHAVDDSSNLLWLVSSSNIDKILKAEGKEPLKPEVIPEYKGQTNPFPQRFVPVVKKASAQRISPEELEARIRASRATKVVQEIRRLLRNDQLFRADISEITIDAYMHAGGIVRVLTNGNWMQVGDKFDVPITSRDQLQDYLDELSDLSTELSEIVSSEVAERMVDVQTYDVVVKEIHEDKVVLVDENDQMHIIDIEN